MAWIVVRKFSQPFLGIVIAMIFGHAPIIFPAILALLLGLWAGLLRLGWTLPAFPNLALAHGPLMVSGFLGVLIPLERAVAIRQRWMFMVPVLPGLGWMGLLIAPVEGKR